MAAGCLKNRFCLLLWKNFILKKRHWLQTIFEVFVIPLILVMLMLIVRALVPVQWTEEKGYNEFDPRNADGTFVASYNIIMYAPNTDPEVVAIMDRVESQFNAFSDNNKEELCLDFDFRGFRNEKSLLKDYKKKEFHPQLEDGVYQGPMLAAVVFKTSGSFGGKSEISYTLRFPTETGRWWTDLLYPAEPSVGPRQKEQRPEEPGYHERGFLFLQYAIDLAIIQKVDDPNNPRLTDIDIKLKAYSYPRSSTDYFAMSILYFFPIVLMLSYAYSIASISKAMVQEKEEGLKEFMKMMGLPGWLHWTAWLTRCFIQLAIPTAIITVFLKIKVPAAILPQADGSLLFIFILLYVFSAITFGFLVGSVCSKSSTAATLAAFLFLSTSVPYFVLTTANYLQDSAGAKIGSCLFINSAFCLGCHVIAMFEGTGAGIRWSHLARSATPDDNVSLLSIMGMMLLDGLMHLFLAIYIEAVFPGEFGVSRKWYYPVTRSFWCCCGKGQAKQDSPVVRNNQGDVFEMEPEDADIGIRTVDLKKVFGKEKKVAVDGLNLNFHEDQVTALLGHSGAGKTTTMSMLTGLCSPTSGTAYVKGFDIRTDIQKVRKSVGVCPQRSILFDDLTVEEHLTFFCMLKGCSRPVEPEIDGMLFVLQLEEKRHAQARTLSEGMKRKLSVGIAFVGGSEVVFLDEPTEGMDPRQRRCTWDLIGREKQGRMVVLSTHYTAEADLLGDRIAIMAYGKVICCGSPAFLKWRYGGGYHLTILKERNCQVELVMRVIHKYIPEVSLDQNVRARLGFSLPADKASALPTLFHQLDVRMGELGISSYGCSMTQIEEVFRRIEEQMELGQMDLSNGLGSSTRTLALEAAQDDSTPEVSVTEVNEESGDQPRRASSHKTKAYIKPLTSQLNRNKGCFLFFQQLRAMLAKKAIYSIRSWLFLLVHGITVTCFLLVVWWMLSIRLSEVKSLKVTDPVDLPLDLKKYDDPITPLVCAVGLPAPGPSLCKAYKGFAGSQSTVEKTKATKLVDFIKGKAKSEGQAEVDLRYIVGLQIAKHSIEVQQSPQIMKETVSLHGFFTNQPYHAAPVALNFISNSLLHHVTGNGKLRIKVSNHPLPGTPDPTDSWTLELVGIARYTMSISLAMSLLVSSFIIFPVQEREGLFKRMQFNCGVSSPVFWLGHLIFDGLYYLTLCGLLVVTLRILPVWWVGSAELEGLVVLFFILLMYGWAILPMTYLFSFLFSSPACGYLTLVLVYFVSGVVAATLGVFGLIRPVLQFVPNFGLMYGIAKFYQAQVACEAKKTDCGFSDLLFYPTSIYEVSFPMKTSYPEGLEIAFQLLFFFIDGLICYFILFLVEFKVCQKLWRLCKCPQGTGAGADDPVPDDEVVTKENERIRKSEMSQLSVMDIVILKDLTKRYGKLLAVDGICLGIERGQCFGLLGVDGAGKSTVFKMLTGEISITSGDAYISGKSVTKEVKQVRKVSGYCLHLDTIIPELTGKETIRLFARARGIQEKEINGMIEQFSAELLLEDMDKQCGTYSWGNKRKLSVVIALIGDPSVVFLDEPTAGMDLVARRRVWNTMINLRKGGASIILKSQSIEECEALCTQLAIMTNGKFCCLGTTQNIGNQLVDGYSITAQQLPPAPANLEANRVGGSLDRSESLLDIVNSEYTLASAPTQTTLPWEKLLQPLRTFIEESFPDFQLMAMHPGNVHYHIPRTVSFSELFGKMEEAKERFRLGSYSIGQTSLEQVFLGVAESTSTRQTKLTKSA